MTDTKTPRVTRTLMEREVSLFSPMKAGDPYIAMLDGLHFVFRGATAMRAKRAAETWRATEYEKLTSTAQRAREAAE